MSDVTKVVNDAKVKLKKKFDTLLDKSTILRSPDLRDLYQQVKKLPLNQRAAFGKEVNKLKVELAMWVEEWQTKQSREKKGSLDLTAPYAPNTAPNQRPAIFTSGDGSKHPITAEIELICGIFSDTGFDIEDSRTLDDEYHMFDSLNFPKNHPARDEYDTFITDDGLILPAHTSTMQNRIYRRNNLPIHSVIPGRVFRNEDIDSTHEHTFHQIEGVVVDKGVTLGDMFGTLKVFLEAYFSQKINYRVQPFYFPFVEPGLEFLIQTPKALADKVGSEWMEILGCGMIHPQVLLEGKIDPEVYQGFAWGGGIERLVMLKYGIDDIRLFMSGNIDFLKQFSGVKR